MKKQRATHAMSAKPEGNISSSIAIPETRNAAHPEISDPFVVAALGASAGGLTALEGFFENMAVDAGIAFIVVQHLSPDHVSCLGELLSRCTRMTVAQAQDNTPVKPNHVYVIPPNATLTIKDCILHIAPPAESRGRLTSIDRVFCSLAEDRGEYAVCILLSGTGTDGTLGLRAVKEHGGMAMAQNIESAKYEAMLRSAIATGLVDHILPVEQMPATLMEYVAHLGSLGGISEDIRNQIAKYSGKIHGILRRRVGHDFSQYKEGTISRRLERRLRALRIESVDRYVQILDQHAEEADLLFKDLLVGVTEFFRDPEAFAALTREVIPKLFERSKETGQIRVCVAGCATGEEAYSLAILLCEHASAVDDPPEIKIFATDIDERSLEMARRGSYPLGIAEHVSADRLERFFVRQDGAYQINRELRELCLFSRHSFIKDPPFSRLDLVSCRNVMIYLGESLQSRVVPLFHYALRPDRYLFLGTSENVNAHRELFRPIDKKNRIFQKKNRLPRAAVAFPLGGVTRPRQPDAKPSQADEQQLSRRLERIILHRYAPACVIVNEGGDAVYFSGGIGRYLEQPPGSPNTNVMNMAREGLRIPLRSILHRAVTSHKRAIQSDVLIQTSTGTIRVELLVEPLPEIKDANLFMIVVAERSSEGGKPARGLPTHDASSEEIIGHLEAQLQSAREHAQMMLEELESTNEELSSANEEFQSTNEELETSKEELQSFNEELETVNTELNRKVTELDTVNSDLQNLLNSTQIATVFLDTELRVRNFTPAAGGMFHLLTSDFGRPITDLASQFTDVDLVEDARQVLATLSLRERQVTRTDGRHYQHRILPYKTVSNMIAGVILTFVDVTQLRRAEQLAQQARAYAESIVDTVREPLVVLDGGMRVVSASKSFYDGFQVLSEETIGRSLFDLGNRQWDIPQLRILLESSLSKSQRIEDYEVDHEFPQLGRRIMLLSGRRLEQGYDKDSLFLLAIEDITDRKMAEDALRASERRNREIIEALPETVYTTDAEGRVTMFNHAAVEFSGSVPQLGSDSWSVTWKASALDGTALPHDQNPMAIALRENRPVRGVEAIAERPDGTIRHFVAYPTPLHDESGKLTGAVNMLVDITVRKSIEDKLRKSEEQLRAIFEQTSGGIAQTDLTGRFLMVNEGFCRIVGRSSENLMNLRMQDITHPDDLPESAAKFTALVEGRSSEVVLEERYVRPDGEQAWVQNQVSAIRDDRGRIRYIAASVANITDRKRMEQERHDIEDRERELAVTMAVRDMEAELARVSRALTVGELATTIAHEVNQPLAGIVTNAEACLRWLSSKTPNLREAQESLGLIVRDSNLASQVIRRIREFLKKDGPQASSLDINDVIQDALVLAQSELLKSKIAVRVDLSSDLPHVWADRIQLQQVILNLIMNGREAMASIRDEPRELALLSRRSEGENVLVAVRDTGTGLSPEKMDRIFDAFFTTKPMGMGLGLSISRSIIEAHGGRIWPTRNEGSGITVQFTVPTGRTNQ